MSLDHFTEDELEVTGTLAGFMKPERYNTPITPRENMLRLYEGKTPMWIPSPWEAASIKVDCDPENVARSPSGGVEWEKYVTVPDPETWDWAGAYEKQKDALADPTLFTTVTFGSCLFERLIAVMDFENAAMALVDDDQKEGVHRFLRAVTDYRKKYYTLVKKWFDPDGVNFNDDWGSQRAEFFSRETAAEMLVPYVKESVQCAHDLGMYVDLHCCGFVEGFVPFFIEEGFDTWGGQPLNDKPKLKKLYPNSLVFTHQIDERPDASDEEIDAAVAKFMEEFGYDNRGFYGGFDPRYRRKVYEASRKNYDRLVAEGKAVV